MNFSRPLLKRTFIFGIIAALVASALIGIFVLLTGNMDDVDWEVLGTTLMVGIFSITSLACLRSLEPDDPGLNTFGAIGILLSVMAFAVITALIWWNPDSDADFLSEAGKILAVLAVSAAHISLLMPLRDRSRNIAALLAGTIVFIVLVAGTLIYLVFTSNSDSDTPDLVFRLLGVFAILDVLGTIMLPILAKFTLKSAKSDA